MGSPAPQEAVCALCCQGRAVQMLAWLQRHIQLPSSLDMRCRKLDHVAGGTSLGFDQHVEHNVIPSTCTCVDSEDWIQGCMLLHGIGIGEEHTPAGAISCT